MLSMLGEYAMSMSSLQLNRKTSDTTIDEEAICQINKILKIRKTYSLRSNDT